MLRVDVDKTVAQSLQKGELDRCVVYERTTFTGRGEFATYDTFGCVVFEVVLCEEVSAVVAVQVECSLYDTTGGSCLYAFAVGTIAKDESDGSEEDGLAGTRLTCDNRKSVVQLKVELFDESIVFYVEMSEHVRSYFILFQYVLRLALMPEQISLTLWRSFSVPCPL